MWGSYGSYSSMSSITMPMDIRPSPSRSYDSVESHYAHRPSFSSCSDDKPTSFLSDDDLFPSDAFEDDARSVTSSVSGVWSPAGGCSPRNDADLLRAMEREREAKIQRDLETAMLLAEEKRRRSQQLLRQQAMLSSRKRKSSKNSKTKTPKLVAITE